MFVKTSSIKRKLSNFSYSLFNKIENNGNCNFSINGEEAFLKNCLQFLKSQNTKITIFDVGANVGHYSEKILELAKGNDLVLHVFEPTKNCFDDLSKRFSRNDSVILNNLGLSDSNDTRTIYYDSKGSSLASLYMRNLDTYKVTFNQSEKITLTKLSEYVENQEIKHIHFIKIDIEGHELFALNGFEDYLNSSFIDFLQFEYGGANLDSHTTLLDFYNLFKEHDFSLAKIMPTGLELREYSPCMENFQYANYVAISNRVLNDYFHI